MANMVEPGTVRAGQVVWGSHDETDPWQAATLTYENGVGAVLMIPYVSGEAQFSEQQKWFDTRDVPRTLVFADSSGKVTFSEARWYGTNPASFGMGRIIADCVVLANPRKIRDSYRVKVLRSRIDGLQEFTRFTSITDDFADYDPEKGVTFNVLAKDEVSWRHGGYTFKMRGSASWTNDSRTLSTHSESVIESHTSRGATANDHLTAQWPIRALLLLLHGRKLSWRKHWVVDEQFPIWTLDGRAHGPYAATTDLRRTIRDQDSPEPTSGDVALPMLHLRQIGSRGLRRWMKLYEDPVFRRAIEPTVEVINGASRFLEPQFMMLALGLDAMGHYRDPTRGRNVKIQRQIERCILASGLDVSRIGSPRGIAQAFANMNNEIKHPDRGHRPEHLELSLAVDLASVIMRLQLLDLLGISKDDGAAGRRGRDVNFMFEAFRLNDRRISDAGMFVPR